MAFEAGKQGNSVGIKDNYLYVEDDVATAISYCDPCNAILGFSKFIINDSFFIPYQYQPQTSNSIILRKPSWTNSEPIHLDIMKKRLTFRRLNANVLENLQLYKDYQQIASKSRDKVDEAIKRSLSSPTPSLIDINKMELLEYPFLSLRYILESDYSRILA